jgi:hypothetical protein
MYFGTTGQIILTISKNKFKQFFGQSFLRIQGKDSGLGFRVKVIVKFQGKDLG